VTRRSTFPARIEALDEFDGPFDAYRLAADGCDVLLATYPAGTVIDPHSHETHNVGVITRGELVLTIDGKAERFGPGDWYEVPAGVTHAARFEADSAEIEFWFVPD
jgi:quercetin dioxygenase-like cupin family protein